MDTGACRRGVRRRRRRHRVVRRDVRHDPSGDAACRLGAGDGTATAGRPAGPCSPCRRWPASSAFRARASSTRSAAERASTRMRFGAASSAMRRRPTRRPINMNRLGRILTDDEGGRVEVLFVQGSNPAATCPATGRRVAGSGPRRSVHRRARSDDDRHGAIRRSGAAGHVAVRGRRDRRQLRVVRHARRAGRHPASRRESHQRRGQRRCRHPPGPRSTAVGSESTAHPAAGARRSGAAVRQASHRWHRAVPRRRPRGQGAVGLRCRRRRPASGLSGPRAARPADHADHTGHQSHDQFDVRQHRPGERRPAPAPDRRGGEGAWLPAIGRRSPMAATRSRRRSPSTPRCDAASATMPKGMWRRDGHDGFTANVFAPDHLADLAGGATFNDARVEVSAAAE